MKLIVIERNFRCVRFTEWFKLAQALCCVSDFDK